MKVIVPYFQTQMPVYAFINIPEIKVFTASLTIM